MARIDLSKLFAKSLNEPAFQAALVQVAKEKATRPVRHCRCVVVEVPKTPRADDYAGIAPGTVVAFVAREGEPLLRTLTKAIKAKDRSAFTAVVTQIQQMGKEFSRRARSYGKTKRRRDFPSFAEISYSDKALVSHVHVDDVLQIQAHAFPYNGGYLDRKGFSLVEHYKPGCDTPLTCVVVIRRPELSEIEKEALRLVPGRSSANNVGVSPCEPFTPVLLAFVVLTAEYAAEWLYNEFVKLFVCLLHGCDTILASIPDAVLKSKEFQDMLKSLPPEVTAAELLRLRTELLLQKRPR